LDSESEISWGESEERPGLYFEKEVKLPAKPASPERDAPELVSELERCLEESRPRQLGNTSGTSLENVIRDTERSPCAKLRGLTLNGDVSLISLWNEVKLLERVNFALKPSTGSLSSFARITPLGIPPVGARTVRVGHGQIKARAHARPVKLQCTQPAPMQ